MSRPWSRWVEYRGVRELRGPLAVVGGVEGVGWDEYLVIRLADGSVRHGLVLDVNRDVALVQVMEGTSGMDLTGASRCASRWGPPGWAAPATAAANRLTAARR
jgi:V/A-type H+-transporting ATPase subunit B